MRVKDRMGRSSLVGEVSQTLESNKTMIIAVSPVTDNSEQLDKDVDGKSPHSNFIIKFDG